MELGEQLACWIHEMEEEHLVVRTSGLLNESIQIQFVEIVCWHDWIRLARLKRYYHGVYIVILHEHLQHTSPMAVRLGVQELLMTPVKKSAFFRAVRGALHALKQEELPATKREENEITTITGQVASINGPLKQYMLRRFLHGDIKQEHQIVEALSLFDKDDFPNVVCYVQGFIYSEQEICVRNEIVQTICASFRRAFESTVPGLYFLPFNESLIVLFRKTKNSESVNNWQVGRKLFEGVVKELLAEFGIQLYLGIGTLCNEPEKLWLSFQEARIARNMPPFQGISLRYFDELPQEPDIVRSIQYIEMQDTEAITAKETAQYVNLSYSHFVRLFKKETGNTFSEYVTFMRLRKAVWLLRHTTKTIEEISDEANFNTPNYFSSTFKKVVGLTPREYRGTQHIRFS